MSRINLLQRGVPMKPSVTQGPSPFGAARFPSEHPVPIWPVATYEYVKAHLDLNTHIPFTSSHPFTQCTNKLLDSFGNKVEKWKQVNLIWPHCLICSCATLSSPVFKHFRSFLSNPEPSLWQWIRSNLCELQWFIKLKNLATGRKFWQMSRCPPYNHLGCLRSQLTQTQP